MGDRRPLRRRHHPPQPRTAGGSRAACQGASNNAANEGEDLARPRSGLRDGRPAAVLISPDDLAALEETVDISTRPGAREAIAEGLADLAAGRAADNESLRARFVPR
ncbi:MAG: type II toxin-antitoxin system Phd/YefM family antitoxin [Acidimicrobiales bacterium]